MNTHVLKTVTRVGLLSLMFATLTAGAFGSAGPAPMPGPTGSSSYAGPTVAHN